MRVVIDEIDNGFVVDISVSPLLLYHSRERFFTDSLSEAFRRIEDAFRNRIRASSTISLGDGEIVGVRDGDTD